MGGAVGGCAFREGQDAEVQLQELKDQVELWKRCATELDEQRNYVVGLRRSGPTEEKAHLQEHVEELSERVSRLSDRCAQSVAVRWKGCVEQSKLQRKASALGHERERMERRTALAVQTIRPLQNRIEDGDVAGLQDTITELTPRMVRRETRESEFGDLAGVVKSLYDDAVAKSRVWREVLGTMKIVLETAKDGKVSRRDAKRLFSAVKEASLTGLSLHKSDPELTEAIVRALSDYFACEGACGNSVQREIVRRTCQSGSLRDFDFADMAQCVTLVDVEETPENEFYLSRAAAVIGEHEVPEFRQILSSLENILFFLRYLHQEDLALTYQLYRSMQSAAWAAGCIAAAERQYGPGSELVQTVGLNVQSEKDVMAALEQLRTPLPRGSMTMQGLRSIFFSWAELRREEFGILVVPHHTQVVCMLMFLQHLETQDASDVGALIAEVGTGEGKSAIIATLALYCTVFLGKKVHVIVDDEGLVERDFQCFRDLFDRFKNARGEPVQARLCVSASRKSGRFMADESVAVRVDEDADIVYCEAKHVQSFYAQLARCPGTDFDQAYGDRVLILDEVDALVIDEAPSFPFVYENEALSTFATRSAEALLRRAPPEHLEGLATTTQEKRVLRQLEKAARAADRWALHTDYTLDQESNRYVRVRDGRAKEESWSLALEFKNFSEHLSSGITYNDRLFIVSRPRVFRRYNRIIGLSGSVGSAAERKFLSDVYGARFFKVPKFLETCRGSAGHPKQPLGVVIEEDEDAQWRTTCERALACRAKTPVLIIARDRHAATRLAQELHCVASAKGLDGKDVVCSLSRDLFEAQPEQFKENLFKCTQPTGKGNAKAFRVAVTDPRGGRGVDYRVSDADADRAGGLTLIVNYIPKCSRDWTQFLGRTARQDRRGQWMAVLNLQDYAAEVRASGQALSPETAVDTILAWGSAETEARLRQVHGQYHRGLRANELSEEVVRRRLLDGSPASREAMVRLCGEYGHLSLEQIDALASKVHGLVPSSIPSKAQEVGPDPTALPERSARSIALLIDRSSSMLSQDAGGRARFDVCRESIARIFEAHVQDEDQIALYTFESQVCEAFPLTAKGPNRERLSAAIRDLRAPHGLTMLYDGILECLRNLQEAGPGPKFLVTLTDGDDNRSKQQPNGEHVTALLRGAAQDVSLIFITCGRDLKPRTLELINYWAQLAQRSGQVGVHLAASDPTRLQEAFATAAGIMEELEGMTEV